MKGPRWRLFPKYATLIIALVAGVLIVSGAISIFFSYRETRAQLVALQFEKAQGAATRIEQYVLDIEHQLSWTALPRVDAGGDPMEQRRIDYLKLLRQAPAITEVVWIDPQGREQLRVSRLAMDEIAAGADLAHDPKFSVPQGGKTHYGAVYFRKGTEPYMTIARQAGSGGGVTAAEVNLKFVWEVVSRIKIGAAGLAYVVDAGGTLIAHPDISLVLKKSDLSALPQVAARRLTDGAPPPVARDLNGAEVLAAHAPIPTLGWTVFVESPRAEAYAPLYATILRTGLLLLGGLVVATAASFFLARALVRPIRALQDGAAKLGAGELDHRIEVATGDELEGLAGQFNKMGADLKESYVGLERKVEQRTAELSEALDYQTAISEVLRVISTSPTDVAPVFEAILDSASRLLDTPLAGVFRYDGSLVHQVAVRNWPAAAVADAQRFYPGPPHPQMMSGRAILSGEVQVEEDTLADPAYDQTSARLGLWRRMVAAPLLKDGTAIGAIVLAWREPGVTPQRQVDLLKTFADQAVIAIENVRLLNETKEALERQTATAEVLQVISGSVSDSAPVFEKILDSCRRVFDASLGAVALVGDDGMVRFEASIGSTVEQRDAVAAFYPVALRHSLEGVAIRKGQVLHYPDVLHGAKVPAGLRQLAQRFGNYSTMVAPMLWEGRGIGALNVTRTPPRPFSAQEVALAKTFADQAVIAIQNARLFNETREALEQQTATAEILQVISRSPTDVQPVFDAIAERAKVLCEATVSGVTRFDGDLVHLVAFHGASPQASAAMLAAFPMKPGRGAITARAIAERAPVQIADVMADPDYMLKEATRLAGYRSNLAVPMLREGQVVGSIGVCRTEPGVFHDKQVKLLQTFADQAVIAIENVRLFNETKEALERQTATAEILRVISGSVTDTQPVFDAIVQSCHRLFVDARVALIQPEGNELVSRAREGREAPHGANQLLRWPIDRASAAACCILDSRLISVPDLDTAAETFPRIRQLGLAMGFGSGLFVPLLRDARAIGCLSILRVPKGEFGAKEVSLAQTFADQAVIAIENVRLFNETKEALEQQRATSEVLKTISRTTFDLQPVLTTLIESASRLCKADKGMVYLRDGDTYAMNVSYRVEPGSIDTRPLIAEPGTLVGRVALTREIVHIDDALTDPAYTWKAAQQRLGYRTMLGVPMLREGEPIGVVAMWREEVRPFSERDMRVVTTFADQAVIALENVRLVSDIQAKSRELEAANRHKSEFLANMSHELRTPLNAIIGFSEVLSEQMFGELNPKQLEYLQDIHSSGHHLLTLINDILDLSKIEAGRMELDLSRFNLALLLDNTTTLVRERALRQGLTLALEVDERLGDWVADQRKLKQVVINLLSNAVKFTPAGGRITLRARPLDHAVEIAVVDTGVGIAPDQQALVFEEFRQAGGDYLRKTEGTGLGLALAKRFVELHGGTMRLESVPGRGSIFAFVLPQRVLEVA